MKLPPRNPKIEEDEPFQWMTVVGFIFGFFFGAMFAVCLFTSMK
jgi:hypothetical protein